MKQNIVIIGGGLAGYMFAKEFRKHDKESNLTMITQSPGHFYSKPQLSTALTHKKSADDLSMGDPDKMMEQLSATIISGKKVTKINTSDKCIEFDGTTQSYDKLILAVGADKISPPLSGDAIDDVQSVNHLHEYADFLQWLTNKKHLAVMGSGLVGCEFCNDLVNAGYQIEMVALDAYPLMRLVPEAIGRAVQQTFEQAGVIWHLCSSAESVNHRKNKVILETANANEIEVDGVFSAIGLRPHVDLAKAAGLKVNRGVVVNSWLQTSDPDIYALGDCAEVDGHVKQYVAPLLLCARMLAQTIAGQQKQINYPPMPIIIKTPLCPIVALPPEQGVAGEWQVEGSGKDLKALYKDAEGRLQGFALSGKCVSERAALLKEMSSLV
ncbi:MAG: FAD-dependent oxidoreductase [Gammaproteobacteria bacterium]|nr:FAD-dependent oxidoreductase [Gammaproteobacteria bacterium]